LLKRDGVDVRGAVGVDFDVAEVPCDGDWFPLCGLGAALSKAVPWPAAEAGLM
jgi:hypothetical protein